jgi:hypothetical protein
MTNIRKKKNFDSIPSQLLAYELAAEAQSILLAMAAIAGIVRAVGYQPETLSFHWAVRPITRAMIFEARKAAGPDQSQQDW